MTKDPLTDIEIRFMAESNAKHIATMNNEMGEVRDEMKKMNKCIEQLSVSFAKLSTNMEWIQKTYWLIASASIGALITGVMGVVMK